MQTLNSLSSLRRRTRWWQDVVCKDEDGLFRRELDSLANDVHKLTHGQVRRHKVSAPHTRGARCSAQVAPKVASKPRCVLLGLRCVLLSASRSQGGEQAAQGREQATVCAAERESLPRWRLQSSAHFFLSMSGTSLRSARSTMT